MSLMKVIILNFIYLSTFRRTDKIAQDIFVKYIIHENVVVYQD